MSQKKLPPGTGSLIVASLIFLSVGIIVIIKPVSFTMSGGSNRYGIATDTSVFSGQETQVFGAVFILLGLLIGYFAYRHYKG